MPARKQNLKRQKANELWRCTFVDQDLSLYAHYHWCIDIEDARKEFEAARGELGMVDVIDIRRAESMLLPGEKPLSDHPKYSSTDAD